ncbi:AAA family ATPase [Pseudomonas sp. LPB0260]|uniref:helix-turn-helix transcriptional regulator n=1 Tax=Pseudomonas sp. LPB0260 TaxID=2614442 RepID=UPI0015C2AF00|nr:LuxR C-terminal-related transcriptional regulator [Pseudomonas sp. LPB0260]QLC72569.1 AAA family ATPase [Pseudomonas sp. LPB0260]QLC75344.1 AAA family ATPase [Pseudomonas sp. LPB0260]
MSLEGLSLPPSLSLLRTKLAPGVVGARPQLIRRALLQRLIEARERRLVILCAPAGYGKSTLLGQLRQRLQASGARVAWLSCDEADSEPLRLLHYLLAAIDTQLPGFGGSILEGAQGGASQPAQALLAAFLSELRQVEGELYLILDDFHSIRHPALRPLVQGLIEGLPAHVRLIAGTRSRPRSGEGRPLHGDDTAWLRAEDLRVSAEETATYLLELQQLRLSSEQVERLHRRSEGWIGALQLIALSLARHPDPAAFIAEFSGSERHIADYLNEDVLARLAPDLRLFLEQTSVLEQFSADLCNALTGREDAGAILRRLQNEQLFITALDEQGEWFSYHQLFAECLRGRLLRRGDGRRLQLAAARWCEQRSLLDRAVNYALAAGEYAFAAGLLARQGARLLADNQLYGILSSVAALPAQVIREYPVFQVFYAWQLAFEQKYLDAEALIEDISARLLQQGQALHDRPHELLAVAQLIKALVQLYQDRLQDCLAISRHWLGRVPLDQPEIRASLACVQAAAHALLGDYGEASRSLGLARESLRRTASEYLRVVLRLIEALLCKEQARLERGRTLAEVARARVERAFGRHSRVGGVLALAYADLLYEQDRHAAILAELPLATSRRDLATPVELVSRGQLVMVRARFYAGECEPALEQLDEWLTGLQGPGYERVYAQAMGCRVQFLLWLRRPHEAERICLQLQRQLAELPVGGNGDAAVTLVLCQARLALAERRAPRALALLEACLAVQTAEHQHERRLRLSLLLAVACWRTNGAERAFALFQATLQDAWHRGYRRLFLDDALWLLPLWDAWSASQVGGAGSWQALDRQLREQCRRLAVDPQALDDHQQVSPRELDILRLVAAGLANRDIAQALHLSEATIKWHLHKLFAKLGVRSRTQAVLRGRSSGLLGEA